MNKKPYHFLIWCAIYRKQVLFMVGFDHVKQVKEYISKQTKTFKPDFLEAAKTMPELEIGKGICLSVDDFPPVVVFKQYDPKDLEDVGCLVHETSHAVDFLSKQLLLDGEGEARAYLHEFLFMQIKEEMDKRASKKIKKLPSRRTLYE